jgi:transcription termination factor Rho
MSVLDRSALAESPLSDLHTIASELGIDGYRRLRKDDLIDAIVTRQGGEPAAAGDEEDSAEAPKPARRRSSRSRAAKAPEADAEETADADDDAEPARPARPRSRRRTPAATADAAPASRRRSSARDADAGEDAEPEEARPPRRRRSRGARDEDDAPAVVAAAVDGEERIVTGVVDLLGNGSGFVRIDPPEPSDGDVYVSAAQVRRCELVSGDRVSGPVRAPRRSERYPSLVRVDTINDAPADAVAEGTRFDDLPAAFPADRLALGSDDPTAKAIEWLTPIGRGSRVTIVGPARAGKTEALRRIAAALAAQDGLEQSLVLVGVRPEEISEWSALGTAPATALSFASSADAQSQAVERAIDLAKRLAARGGDAVVLIDTLDGLHPPAARKALAAARNVVDGGSLTVIATASAPLGGETTVIALDGTLTAQRRFPAIDLSASGTLRAELLVGDAGAEAIAKARSDAAA